MPTREDLRYYQSLPLDMKIAKTKQNIRECVREYGTDGCYISFSGGKDSKEGCNAFENKRPTSKPMSFWTQQDVLKYIKERDLPIASVYGEIVEKDGQTSLLDTELCTTGCDRTGCIYCGFGAHLEKGEGRFQRLKRTHPRLWEYCIEGGGYDTDGLWKPNDKGLGLRHVFDVLNGIYGDDFIRYE